MVFYCFFNLPQTFLTDKTYFCQHGQELPLVSTKPISELVDVRCNVENSGRTLAWGVRAAAGVDVLPSSPVQLAVWGAVGSAQAVGPAHSFSKSHCRPIVLVFCTELGLYFVSIQIL